jgi:hypothetical protein
MPDLNYANPEVTSRNVRDYPLLAGGHGRGRPSGWMRSSTSSSATARTENLPETLAWLEEFHAFVRSVDRTP